MRNTFFTSMGTLGMFACAAGVALVLSMTGCGSSSSDGDKGNEAVIVCLGDSLTAGRSATKVGEDDASKSYPAFLQTKVNAKVINSGVSGDTATQGYNRLQKDVIAHDPDMVVICLGANDFLGADDVPALTNALDTIKDSITKIVNDLDTKERVIFIAKFYNENSAKDMLKDKGITDEALQSKVIGQCDAMFDDIKNIDTNNVEIVIIDDIWKDVWGAQMSSDNIHPTAAGYEIMANNYFTAMKSILDEYSLVK